MTKYAENIDLIEQNIVKPKNVFFSATEYDLFTAAPATGILYLTEQNRYFISGHVRMRGEPNGAYPHFYDEMVDNLFGPAKRTLEVCSYKYSRKNTVTMDINPDVKPDIVADAQIMTTHYFYNGKKFDRWRADPPYSQKTAKKMYNSTYPSPMKLLKAGMLSIEPGGLMFLLLGPVNFQWCPPGLKRIGIILITVVPNNEIRALNIFYKMQKQAIAVPETDV